MPKRVRDPYSGAILFIPTQEEEDIEKLKDENLELQERVSKIEDAVKIDKLKNKKR